VKKGDTVLDLGSGAGFDLILASKLVGSRGKVIGVDMTDAMIRKARANVKKAGIKNVEVRKGIIEDLPVEDSSVDMVISNCVINLSPEKARVFGGIARVLKPGGRFSISDIVARGLPKQLLRDMAMYAACVAGAISEDEYVAGLRAAGLVSVKAVDRLVYGRDELLAMAGSGDGCCGSALGVAPGTVKNTLGAISGKVASVRFTGRKGTKRR
jgi:SAM-dependent methyltransferase